MSRNFKVMSSIREYEVIFGNWHELLSGTLNAQDVLIVDENVSIFYPQILSLTDRVVLVNPNESSKEYSSIGRFMDDLLARGVDRRGRLIAIGGGITQDMVSFAASILLRGIPWVFVPTNLLAQCDSCIGSKTSVNLGNYKNQLGGFYPPEKIFIDPGFCLTLPKLDLYSGFGEMMHYFLIDGAVPISEIHDDLNKAEESLVSLGDVIFRSLMIKKAMIEVDEFDKGPRVIFNYGHTFGHAIESVTKFKVPHGIAVAYGIDLANLISVELGFANAQFRNDTRGILQKIWQICSLESFDISIYIAALKRDKKNINGQFKPILTSGLGQMFQHSMSFDSKLEAIIERYFKSDLYKFDI